MKRIGLAFFALADALPAQAQVYKAWAAAAGFSGVPVTSPLGGTGFVNSLARTTPGQLHVLAEASINSASLLVGDDQNFGLAGRGNGGPFDTVSPSFFATAAQFVVDDLTVPGVAVTMISRRYTDLIRHEVPDIC